MIYAIVMAAGSGTRFGGDIPKQYVELGGVPVVVRAIEGLRQGAPHARLVVVISPDQRERWDGFARSYGIHATVVYGGSTRWESVRNAMAIISPSAGDIVMVHDGARPMLNRYLVETLLEGAEGRDGAIPVVPVVDSLRMIDSGKGTAVDRSKYFAVQTPQVFDAVRLKEAYGLPYRPEFTDDASVMSACGYDDIAYVTGDYDNIKITNSRDLVIAEALLSRQ